MRRKHNPLVALAALVLLATILVLACTGCAAEAAGNDAPDRFTRQRMGDGITIITDTQTGVEYIFYVTGYAGGLTVLQPGEG